MHRMGYRLSKRFARFPIVADAFRPLERTGVRLTYLLHDRLLDNPDARNRFRTSPPPLDDTQGAIVRQLASDGLAVVPFNQLFPQPGLWQTLTNDAAQFVDASRRLLDEDGNQAHAHLTKKHLLRRYTRGVELTIDDPWVAVGVSPRILDVVNTYLGMYSKCLYVDQWYTIPGGPEAERASSQRWHRDYTDQHLVKVFIYLSDVDEGAGPFEYVTGSADSGRYSRLWPWRPLSDTYPPADEFAGAVPDSALVTCCGSAGTVIFCNTSGFHRGGFATGKPRVMAVYNYASPASLNSLAQRNFHVASLPADVSPAVRFALT